LRGRQDRDTQG